MGIIGGFTKTLIFLIVWAAIFFGTDSIYNGAIAGLLADPGTEWWIKGGFQLVPAVVFLSILYRFWQELSMPDYAGGITQ
jgi:hypothetical protein